ncbi:hypothetical protein [Yinghuangia seranimata]|uniref:hypothetical protein n=1 Tax=Yinghuangia seranimata TaxID=408067 RepID=UPI00248A9827|nr:hypothetical protein [Yinghuangia seranimata]MDI2128397.1 hypothetical protein [Yinghuangia seranimata]
MPARPPRTTAAIVFTRMPTSQNPMTKGRFREDPMFTYYRCMVVAFASVRRWNEDVDLALVCSEPPPAPFDVELAKLGVEVVPAPFTHRPPAGFGRWGGSLFLLDAMEALRDRGGLQMFLDPDILCVRPFDEMLRFQGDTVGVQGERLSDLQKPSSDKFKGYRDTCAAMYPELGETRLEHDLYGGHFYAIPEHLMPVVLERAERAWKLSLARFEQGLPAFTTEEPLMNYAVLAVPTTHMGPHVRSIPTAPWRRFLTDPTVIDGLTLWHCSHEKDMGFRRLYQAAVDPDSWFWTAPGREFRARTGATLSATQQTRMRALLNAGGDFVERYTSERMQNRLKPLYVEMVRVHASLRRR